MARIQQGTHVTKKLRPISIVILTGPSKTVLACLDNMGQVLLWSMRGRFWALVQAGKGPYQKQNGI